jgi:hypothetical protein
VAERVEEFVEHRFDVDAGAVIEAPVDDERSGSYSISEPEIAAIAQLG